MPVTVTRNFGPLDQFELVTSDDMRHVGLLAREMIIERTRWRQVDIHGRPFQWLSVKYAADKHRSLGGVPKPDLTVSGNMLNDITISDVVVMPTGLSLKLGFVK
jgi:hypothetical protein